jgi:hypothetical protein
MPSDDSRPKQSKSFTESCASAARFNTAHTGTCRLDVGLQCNDHLDLDFPIVSGCWQGHNARLRSPWFGFPLQVLEWLTNSAILSSGRYCIRLVAISAKFIRAVYIAAIPSIYCRDAMSKSSSLTGKQYLYSRPEAPILARADSLDAGILGSKSSVQLTFDGSSSSH